MKVHIVEYAPNGSRQCDWRSAAEALQEDHFGYWPVQGPRLMSWVMNFFVKFGLAPTQWLERHLQTVGWS